MEDRRAERRRHAGPAFGTDGTVYVALEQSRRRVPPPRGSREDARSYATRWWRSIAKTLKPKDWFTAAGADFNASPIVVRYKDKDLVAATAQDGRLYLLDGASLGGADHKTALHVTAKYTAGGGRRPGLATWEARGHALDPGDRRPGRLAAEPASSSPPNGPVGRAGERRRLQARPIRAARWR